jgi:TRAP transporter TAXI family solute receptor
MAKAARGIGWHLAVWRFGSAVLRTLLCALALLIISIPSGSAQTEPVVRRQGNVLAPDLKAITERMNANTLTVVTGPPNFVFSAFADDLATVLNDGDELKLLPVATKGGFENVRDVRFLRGIDLGFTITNVLGHFRRTGEIGDLSDKIVYISRISNDEIHVITRSNITSFEQLRGLKVNFLAKGSANQLSAQDICRALNVDVEEVNFAPADAIEKLKNGEIAAAILTSGRPSPLIAPLKASEGYHLIPIPFAKSLAADYLPARLTSADYPSLIPPGQIVETIATPSVLIAYNWPKGSDRYRRVDKFVKAFFTKFDEFKKPPRHPSWRDVNLAATIPGWKRFEGAEEMLAKDQQQSKQVLDDRQSGWPPKDRQLYEEFLRWKGLKPGPSTAATPR